MGQKTNPILLKLEKINNWESKYLGSKITEHSIYTKKDIELWYFISRLFDTHGFILKTCQINYSKKSMHIFISYYQKINEVPGKQKPDNKLKKIREVIKTRKSLLKNLFETITWFMNQRIKVYFTVQKLLNNSLNKVFRNKKSIKKMLIRLQRYKKEKLFWETVCSILACILNWNSSKLLAYFLANQINHFENQNYFFRFITKSLNVLKSSAKSNLKRIKIIIKGRINGWPWSRKKIITIINNICSKSVTLDYGEKVSFTKNGTLGIKTWMDDN